ncbi:MAG: transporter ATP-binding protein [Acidimicrobiaceae bacterium]|nr:transporter ATP-binding protein [Acidimicrobiaceae bacterium]
MSSIAIDIQAVSKRFKLFHEKYSTLKERVIHAGQVPYEEFWALGGVSASIPAGQTVGILGRNGSGKSTLLKCIAGILQPTSGQVVVRGQLAAMLELGAGFQPELSGRDNVYLNGSLLGFSRKDIDRRFDEIVAFAELEEFIDNQVKYYSSGMYVRLGFAVAVSVEPDILLVDEVLAVGDERFQQKCIDRVRRFQEEGRTIVVVSHSPDTMRELCDSVLVLDRGQLVTFAPAGEAIRVFRERLVDVGATLSPTVAAPDATTGEAMPIESRRTIRITGATVEHPGQDERPYLITGEPLTIRANFEVAEPIAGATFRVSVLTERGSSLFSSTSGGMAEGMVLPPGDGGVTFFFDSIPFLDGRFQVTMAAQDARGMVLDVAEPLCHFEVMNPGRAIGVVGLPLRVEVEPPTGALVPPALL